MWDLLERLFGGAFMPHGHCYLWSPAMVWTQVLSNTLIGLAYLSISATLAYLVWRVKLPFSWVYIAFGTFILACGLTHFLDVATVWHPIYWADAGVRVMTATASVGTAVLVFPLVPKVVGLSTISRLAAERGEKLETAVADLQRALEETTRYRLLVESVQDATFVLDPAGNVVTWNAGAEHSQGYSSAEILGQHFAIFYAPEDRASGKPQRDLETAARDGGFAEEGWRFRKNGERVWSNIGITAMRDGSGNVVGFAKVSRDLTERLRAEERLRTLAAENAALAEKARVHEFQERFLAILGHDLRNPLAAIDMGAGLLRQRVAGDAAVDRIFARIESSSQRMKRMIEQILDLTRTRLGGGLEVNRAPMDLGATLTGIVEELRTANPGRTVELRSTALQGSWDNDRLEQVFSNLVGNAIAHSPTGAPVVVSAEQRDGRVTVSVHNGGPAIPDDLKSKLFDPFRRGERDSRTATTAGLGLGLYISREIVLAHGGTISARSTPSDGTTFEVTLPTTA